MDLKNRCWAFMLRLVIETEKRLPDNMEIFEKIQAVKPESVMSGNVKFSDLPVNKKFDMEDLQRLEDQWRQVSQVEWSETKCFENKPVPKDPVTFWSEVREFEGNSSSGDGELSNNNNVSSWNC